MARQIEFPLSVAICAWCRPGERGGALGEVSHGICPKHLRKLERELQRLNGAARTPARRARRGPGNDALLFPLLVPA
ncbi:hypothetical protein SBV1_1760014 [Verrucomicrobia bacterium]|nr:hypothetical protein SBV1_1760014 [Verrucomicrobiota bacterium]